VIREARVYADARLLARAVTEETLRIMLQAVVERGSCNVCLSGGTTPKSLNELWTEEYAARFPWKQIQFFFGDERYVPADDARSNFRMARETLLTRVPIPPENVHPMPTDFERPADAAAAYESEMRKVLGERPEFDIVFLGVGPEGHTASLFPDSPALAEKKRWVVAVEVPAETPQRLTLTLPVLNSARNVFFLAEGSKKREIVAAIRRDHEGDTSVYPAARVISAGHVIWYLDQAAAW